ncbi:MAG: methyl-accepting chemotaxis protein, partial [Methanospirillaceae archaeon]|nr:methyl-accepting chemotaxis protein [Methanospirillaceae archaeon]
MKLTDYSIGTKIIGGYIIITLFLILIGGIAFITLDYVSEQTDRMYQEETVPLTRIGEIEVGLHSIRALTFRNVAVPEEYLFDAGRIQDEIAKIDANITLLAGTPMNTEQKAAFTLFATQWDDYTSVVHRVGTLIEQGRLTEVHQTLVSGGEHADARRATEDTFAEMKRLALQNAEKRISSTKDRIIIAKTTIVSVIIIAAVIAAILGIFLTRDITKPLNRIVSSIHKLKKGVFSNGLAMNRKDEIGIIADGLDEFGTVIKTLVADVTKVADATVAGDLSARADVTCQSGEFARIPEKFNSTLDSITGPLHIAAEYVDRISKGDIPDTITDTYYGDFNEIKNNLNTCIDA